METKYYVSWEEYISLHPEISPEEAEAMAVKFQSYEELMFSFIMNLCV